jgi:hypothetical protein
MTGKTADSVTISGLAATGNSESVTHIGGEKREEREGEKHENKQGF